MGDVLEFLPPDQSFYAGDAICLGCKHEWIGVWAAGTQHLECPNCGGMRGVGKNPIGTIKERFVCFVKDCHCFYFIAVGEGLICTSCGWEHKWSTVDLTPP